MFKVSKSLAQAIIEIQEHLYSEGLNPNDGDEWFKLLQYIKGKFPEIVKKSYLPPRFFEE